MGQSICSSERQGHISFHGYSSGTIKIEFSYILFLEFFFPCIWASYSPCDIHIYIYIFLIERSLLKAQLPFRIGIRVIAYQSIYVRSQAGIKDSLTVLILPCPWGQSDPVPALLVFPLFISYTVLLLSFPINNQVISSFSQSSSGLLGIQQGQVKPANKLLTGRTPSHPCWSQTAADPPSNL